MPEGGIPSSKWKHLLLEGAAVPTFTKNQRILRHIFMHMYNLTDRQTERKLSNKLYDKCLLTQNHE